MNNDLEISIGLLRENSIRYQRFERYYRGEHDLAFATDKFANAFGSQFREFALNLCPAVCDAVRDKLKITGFSVESIAERTAFTAADIEQKAAAIWRMNRMDVRAGELHKEALKNGDAYAIVWPNADGRAVIYPKKAANCAVVYDTESPGKIISAAKFWQTPDKYTRLNIYYADRTERFITRSSGGILLPAGDQFVPYAEDGNPAIISNPFGRVPVFHFANNADIGDLGMSELSAAIPVQDGLNKSVLDMLVAMEFCAYRQRWAAGIEIEYDADGVVTPPFNAGIDHLWISENPSTRFGEFADANLDQFLKVKESFRVDIASVTGTPLHYLQPQNRMLASGEALKKAETRFIAKIRDRQNAFGRVWEDALAFALDTEGRGSDISLLAAWQDPSPVSERELLENIQIKRSIGLPSDIALTEAGYGKASINEMTDEKGDQL